MILSSIRRRVPQKQERDIDDNFPVISSEVSEANEIEKSLK